MEEWKDVNGYEGMYQISNKGNVRSLDRISYHKRGVSRYKGKPKKKRMSTFGYWMVSFSKENKSKNFYVHKLMGIAFIPNPKNKKFINHKNGIKTDNQLENLEWVTHSENMNHELDTGLRVMPKGVKVYNSKLNPEIIISARKEYSRGGITYQEIADKNGVCKRVMMNAMKGKHWQHVTECLDYESKKY